MSKKLNSNKGFTLMEMLIVVAIIAILVAIAIPSFSSALIKAREAADEGNIRSTYAQIMVEYLDEATPYPADQDEFIEKLEEIAPDGLNYEDKLTYTYTAATTGTAGTGTIVYDAERISDLNLTFAD